MSIFKNKTEMPLKDNSPDVVRTALTMPEAQANLTPVMASSHAHDGDVINIERPRFGHAN